MKPEILEQTIKVEMSLSEYEAYQKYLKRANLREVRKILRVIEAEGRNEKKAPTVDASDWLQNWKRRKEKEESDKLEEQRKQEAMSPAERLAEVDAVLATLEEKADKS